MQQQVCLLFNRFSENTLIISTLFNERKTVNPVENYFGITIPQYEPDDFRSHFRLTRSGQKISKCDEYNINKMCLLNANAPDNGQVQRWSRSQGQIT